MSSKDQFKKIAGKNNAKIYEGVGVISNPAVNDNSDYQRTVGGMGKTAKAGEFNGVQGFGDSGGSEPVHGKWPNKQKHIDQRGGTVKAGEFNAVVPPEKNASKAL